MKRTCDDIVFGTWGLSGAFGELPKGQNPEQVISFARERGIHRFDTAIVYGSGQMEEILGSICGPEDEIATKVPAMIKPDPASTWIDIKECYPLDHVMRSIEGSLARLRRNYIDILQFHNWHSSWDAEYVFDLIAKVDQEGLIRKWGVSLPDLFSAAPPKGFDVIQTPYNLAEVWPAAFLSEYPAQIRARSIFAHGALTGSKPFTDTDARKSKFNHAFMDRIAMTTNGLRPSSTDDLRDKAFRFCAHQPWISKIIIGFRQEEHIEAILNLVQ